MRRLNPNTDSGSVEGCDAEGRLLGYDFTDRPGELTEFRAVCERLLAAAVPLRQFIATMR